MFAVLVDGIRAASCDRSPRLRLEALRWVRSAERAHPFAFEALCDVFGLDADSVRNRVLLCGRGPRSPVVPVRGGAGFARPTRRRAAPVARPSGAVGQVSREDGVSPSSRSG